MAWMVGEYKLDTEQRAFLDGRAFRNGNIWIRGFPGSGKSVLLAYTIKHLINDIKRASVIVIVFTRALVQMYSEVFREIGIDVEVMTYQKFMNSVENYDYIFCDEVQDMAPSILREMDSRSKHVVVAGDESQSIYDKLPNPHEETVSPEDIISLLSANDYKLNTIHRLSSSIINAVMSFMPKSEIFKARRDMTKASTQIRVCSANDPGDEVTYIMREAGKATKIGETAVILLPTRMEIIQFANMALEAKGKDAWDEQLNRYGKPDFYALNKYLSSKGVGLKCLVDGAGDFNAADHKIMIMTFHSSKGLDFDNVFIPFMDGDQVIFHDQRLARTLLMVAMTRSRNNLYLTYTHTPHHYITRFADQCHSIKIGEALATAGSGTSQGSDNIFGI